MMKLQKAKISMSHQVSQNILDRSLPNSQELVIKLTFVLQSLEGRWYGNRLILGAICWHCCRPSSFFAWALDNGL